MDYDPDTFFDSIAGDYDPEDLDDLEFPEDYDPEDYDPEDYDPEDYDDLWDDEPSAELPPERREDWQESRYGGGDMDSIWRGN